jgi:hypothetical protein
MLTCLWKELLAGMEGFALHLQIDLHVSVGGFDRGVPQPGADHTQIEVRLQNVKRSRMSPGMGNTVLAYRDTFEFLLEFAAHGIGSESDLPLGGNGLPVVTKDALAGKHGEYDMVLAIPPPPHLIAEEITEDLETALENFAAIADDLKQ